MLPKRLRLRHKSQFKKIFEAGRSYPGKFTVIYVLSGERKVGFIASKKVGNSVMRNRARRLMREVIRLHLDEIDGNVQIILIARPAIRGVSYREVEQSLLPMLKRARVLR